MVSNKLNNSARKISFNEKLMNTGVIIIGFILVMSCLAITYNTVMEAR